MGNWDKFGNRVVDTPDQPGGYIHSVDLGVKKEAKLKFDPEAVSRYFSTFSDMSLRGRRVFTPAETDRFVAHMNTKYDGVDEAALRAEVARMAKVYGTDERKAAA